MSRSVYIAGRMHCGSTFLSTVLGADHQAMNIGELVNGMKRGPEQTCACGETLETCDFWSRVASAYAQRTGRDLFIDGKWLYDHADIRKFLTVYRQSELTGDWARYAELQNAIVDQIAQVAETPVIVDSSKEFTRGLLTLKAHPENRVVHLIRGPQAVVASYYWRQTQGSRFYFMKRNYDARLVRFPALMLIAVAWNVGIVAGWLQQRTARDRVLHVSYEKFCDNPASELARIGAFASIDVTKGQAAVTNATPIPLDHALGGNDEIKSDDRTFTFVPNAKGRRKMPLAYRIGVTILSAPGVMLQKLLLET